LTRRILGAGEVQASIPEIFSKIMSGGADCLAEILGSDPGLQGSVDWDRAETLGKVRASPEDVITKAKYAEHEIIYSKDGKFPVLDAQGQPPAGLEWQKNRHHGLVISSESHLISVYREVVEAGSPEFTTFLAANKEVQQFRPTLLTAEIWTARTVLFLIRLFATVIG
jgi:hypothetical protein